jgi:hypothetical protein
MTAVQESPARPPASADGGADHDRARPAPAARILQIPPGTVKSRTFDGLRALRRALAAHDAVAQHSAATPSPGPPGRRPRPLGRPKPGVSRGTD